MNLANRIIFQFFALSLLANWVVLYVLSRGDFNVNWVSVLIGVTFATVIPVLLARKPPPLFIKVKTRDRALFIDDLVRAMDHAGYIASAAFENRIFFKRALFFPPQEEVIEVKTLEDEEYLIKFPPSALKPIQKHLAAYIKLRNIDFLKETDKLMEEQP